MDFYIFTLEFWQNIVFGLLAGASVCVGILGVRWFYVTFNERSGCFSTIMWLGGQIFMGVTFVYNFPLKLVDYIHYDRLHEWRYGAVGILQQDEPLLYNNFVELNRLRDKERSVIQSLKEEKDKATFGSAQELYDKQIAKANERLSALQAMRFRINDLAVRMYFVSYIEKLEQRTTSKEFQDEFRQTKADSDALMKLHAETHE